MSKSESSSRDDAAKWVQQSLAEKNRLRASDAAHVEASFATKLAELATTSTEVAQAQQRSLAEARDFAAMEPNTNANNSNERAPSHAIDKSALALPEPRRVRDRDHIRSIVQKPCLVCGRRPSDPHHLRFAQSRALSSKVSDQFTVPLCRGHHRELHRSGDEVAWWERQGIDALGHGARAIGANPIRSRLPMKRHHMLKLIKRDRVARTRLPAVRIGVNRFGIGLERSE